MAKKELVVFSHLRWDFVWQRPQQLISRLATEFDRAWFVEEPRDVVDLEAPRLVEADEGPVTRLWLEVPGTAQHRGFGDEQCADYPQLVRRRLGARAERTAWLYTPMALPLAQATDPTTLVYDVMDDLASFAFAPAALRHLHRQTLQSADLVFSGGRSLQRGLLDLRADAYCFPSGVEPSHYEVAKARRQRGERPVAGYVGVIDERLDLGLIRDLAAELPDWEIEIVGPVVKIDPADLPAAPNLIYPGPRPYSELPDVMAGFDVALMPFALNEATRSISPTKTLEYLAAGLPVVSTRVPDVVADYSSIVALADDGHAFADACRRALVADAAEHERRVRPLLHWNHWDTIAARMASVLSGSDLPEVVGARAEGAPA